MHREHIQATPSWRDGPPRYDCCLVNTGEGDGIEGLEAGRIQLFFSFVHRGVVYPCALVHWYSRAGNQPHEVTGMWVVKPDFLEDGHTPFTSVVHLSTIYRAAHLIAVHSDEWVPHGLTFNQSLDFFETFFISHFADIHMFESLYDSVV